MMWYCGWNIRDNGPGYHPITGRWRAKRWDGITLGGNTRDLVKRMIDFKIQDKGL